MLITRLQRIVFTENGEKHEHYALIINRKTGEVTLEQEADADGRATAEAVREWSTRIEGNAGLGYSARTYPEPNGIRWDSQEAAATAWVDRVLVETRTRAPGIASLFSEVRRVIRTLRDASGTAVGLDHQKAWDLAVDLQYALSDAQSRRGRTHDERRAAGDLHGKATQVRDDAVKSTVKGALDALDGLNKPRKTEFIHLTDPTVDVDPNDPRR